MLLELFATGIDHFFFNFILKEVKTLSFENQWELNQGHISAAASRDRVSKPPTPSSPHPHHPAPGQPAAAPGGCGGPREASGGAGAAGVAGEHGAAGDARGGGPRSAQPRRPGRPLSPRASPPRHQRCHQPRRVRPRVPRCLRPRAPGSNNEPERRDRGPGLRRRQPRGRRISISRPSCLLVRAHFPARMLGTSQAGCVLSSGATETERGCPDLRSLRGNPASRPARSDFLGDGLPGKKGLGREPGKGRLRPKICPKWALLPGKLLATVPAAAAQASGRTGSGARLTWMECWLCSRTVRGPGLQSLF